MNPSIYVVSGDPEMGRRLIALLLESGAGAATLFRTGGDCLRALDAAAPESDLTVIVDGTLDDVAPLNLGDAVRSRRPDSSIIFSLTSADEHVVQRAMLAGARAVIERTRVEAELLPTVRRVALTSQRRVQAGLVGASDPARQGASVVVTGACGGAGRSTVSTLLAWASARQDTDTALVDFDLQFGDLAFLHDALAQPTLMDLVTGLSASTFDARGYGRQIRDNLTLYSASPQPEQAELVAPKVRQVLRELQGRHEFVVVNTGAFWTLFHAELLDSADLCVLVLGQTAAAIQATVQAKALCGKLGVPDARIACLMNRIRPRRTIAPADAAAALNVAEVLSLPDGGDDVATFFDAGEIEGLFTAKNALPPAIEALLGRVRRLAGLSTPEAVAPRRRGLLRRRA